jgi:site-specific DNA-methyltransferase (adenine-specific)
MSYRLINADCLTWLRASDEQFDMLLADPPDGIGLKYKSYNDKTPKHEYEVKLVEWIECFIEKAPIVWLSFNARWTFAMGVIVHALVKNNADWEAKPLIQNVTFGQNCKTDCGNGHRPLWRLKRKKAKLYPNQIKVPSWRLLNGDKRAAPGGRVPLDVWDFPRVTGNSKQRRKWHVTQLHEGLVERCIQMSTAEGQRVIDPFGGSGTTMRVCRRINRDATLVEFDPFYCERIAFENELVERTRHTGQSREFVSSGKAAA